MVPKSLYIVFKKKLFVIIAFNNSVIHASSVDKAMILARNISKARTSPCVYKWI